MSAHPNQVLFAEGVRLILGSWTALNLAVEMDWSEDGLAEEKFEWLADDVIVDYFSKKGKSIDADEMDEILDQIMKDEFNTILEDDSTYHVGKQLVQLYTQIIQGNYSGIEALRAAKANKKSSAAQESLAGPQSASDDDDDDDDDEEEEEEREE
ncbi:Pre-rRNA-processing protein TSR2-domain-containing protein [Piptocephalis cylindrospora]|uniref:Pre-rRNA-processing protein TSR2-domain-containing protein n=1 Tax=Piptocephalis cylindrospora TaxID=1907219 RepID=A0A4P9Y843_9FUNG|nr:Pre-rRNA-processing protein TSR2-domain-containing protein [Piptocephalis cylindrospora]|eukprot:RKP15185.1 Pre-rRNA-processing protein TSR2-domain-containing protein [Piptocephalis cylindrospora]